MTSAAAGPYGPLTKSIDIDEALALIVLTREFPSVPAWRAEALVRLPQASLQRRQEIVRFVQTKFLDIEGDHFVDSPSVRLLAAEKLGAKLRRDLLLAQYLRATPLVWEAVRDVVLPHAEASTRQLGKASGGEITLEDWIDFLAGRLNTSTPSTVEKTRNHITAHLTKFGLLEARAVPGDRIAKRFFARSYEPDARAFWFSLALEFDGRGLDLQIAGFRVQCVLDAHCLLRDAGVCPLCRRGGRARRPGGDRFLRLREAGDAARAGAGREDCRGDPALKDLLGLPTSIRRRVLYDRDPRDNAPVDRTAARAGGLPSHA